MAGERDASPLRQKALLAFEHDDSDACDLLAQALEDNPLDGQLLISHAAALARTGGADPFAKLEQTLVQAPDWIEGHKALARLKAQAGSSNALSSIEASLDVIPKNPRIWMAYLTLLGSAGRHDEAAAHTARLRQTIADLPELRLVEARHRGFAGEFKAAGALLDGLPKGLPELSFEQARCAMRLGNLDQASSLLEAIVAKQPQDIGAWALAELCWRATGSSRHGWLCPSDTLFVQSDLGFDKSELERLGRTLRTLHIARGAPLGQSVEGGTQTHGNLRLRQDEVIHDLFERIDRALADYTSELPRLETAHPLAALCERPAKVSASWSILLHSGGRHVPHLHDGGRVSSAAHIAIPPNLGADEGQLELGLPPEDIPLALEPIARFEPKPGYLVLFPSFVYHSTSRFAEGERLTVAFDAV